MAADAVEGVVGAGCYHKQDDNDTENGMSQSWSHTAQHAPSSGTLRAGEIRKQSPTARIVLLVTSHLLKRLLLIVLFLLSPVLAAMGAPATAPSTRPAATRATATQPATNPATKLDENIYAYCDYCTPNEGEASLLTGIEVTNLESARKAADVLLAKGVGAALITLGGQGSLLHGKGKSIHIPIFGAGKVVDTTGAGDAFNGGFAASLARGATAEEAARFGSATAGISVTRYGTAPSMPYLHEIEALLKAQP